MSPGEKNAPFIGRSKPAAVLALKGLASFTAGVSAALVLHYLLYRIGIPGTPFIYVVF